MIYPLFVVACLYVEWFLAWTLLGHAPRPSIDDPKFIPGASSMHWVTLVAFVSLFPIAVAGLAVNALYVARDRFRWSRLAARWLGVIALVAGAIVWMRWDPWRVVDWWLD